VLWLLVFYLAALALLMITSLWQQDPFTAKIVHEWTFDNYTKVFTGQDYLWMKVFARTIGIATLVTVVDIALAFPLAWFGARIVAPRWRLLIFLAVVVPLWSSILVRIFSWRSILGSSGILNSFLIDVGILDHPSTAFLYNWKSSAIVWIYVWLPFMVLPIFAALEKIPDSYLEASRDLGAKSFETFRKVIFPLAIPGVVAGSIFVFSLTMGDFVAPTLVGGSEKVLGGAIKEYAGGGSTTNLPFAAALASLTMLTLIVFLTISRRTGAMENL
jgi:putative spermidine/putrescine transport system permease protein